MTYSVTKATPIQFTNGKSGIKKRRGRKTALPGYYACFSCDLLLMASGRTHTHIPTFVNEAISRNQACAGHRSGFIKSRNLLTTVLLVCLMYAHCLLHFENLKVQNLKVYLVSILILILFDLYLTTIRGIARNFKSYRNGM